MSYLYRLFVLMLLFGICSCKKRYNDNHPYPCANCPEKQEGYPYDLSELKGYFVLQNEHPTYDVYASAWIYDGSIRKDSVSIAGQDAAGGSYIVAPFGSYTYSGVGRGLYSDTAISWYVKDSIYYSFSYTDAMQWPKFSIVNSAQVDSSAGFTVQIDSASGFDTLRLNINGMMQYGNMATRNFEVSPAMLEGIGDTLYVIASAFTHHYVTINGSKYLFMRRSDVTRKVVVR